MTLSRMKIHEGKAKILYSYPQNSNYIVQHFKDDVTAFNAQKFGVIPGKGVINNYVSEFLMKKLSEIGISTHFVDVLNMREQLIRKVEIIPIEVVVRNVVAGSLSKRSGLEEGTALKAPIVELYYKNDALHDPFINDEHAIFLGLIDSLDDLDDMKILARRVNDFLSGIFSGCDISLVDFKLEFGYCNDEIVLADEISPDTCRLWDVKTGEKMDKDRFRRDLGQVIEHYREVAKRLGVLKSVLGGGIDG